MRSFKILFLFIFVIYLSGCGIVPTNDYSMSNESYLIGWVLHNVNDSTNTYLNYSKSEMSIYNMTFNYPGSFPNYYSVSFLWNIPKYSSNEYNIEDPVHSSLYPPTSRIYYVYGKIPPKGYFSNWSIDVSLDYDYLNLDSWDDLGYVSQDVNNKISIDSPENKSFSFGSGNFIPASFIFDGTSLKLNHHFLMGLDTHLSMITKGEVWNQTSGYYEMTYLEVPTYSVFKNNVLVDSGNLTSNGVWNYSLFSYDLDSNAIYYVNVTIPLASPLWNKTIIQARFNSSIHNLPVLNDIKVPNSFNVNQSLNISFNFSGNLKQVNLYYSTNTNKKWNELNVQGNSWVPLKITENNVKFVNLKILAVDNSNNSLIYLIYPAMKKAQNLLFNITPPKTVRKGENLTFDFKCRLPNGSYCKDIRYDVFLNKVFLFTKNNHLSYFNYKLPSDFSDDYANFSFVFHGTGIYNPVKSNVSFQLGSTSHDLAIDYISFSNIFLTVGDNLTVSAKIVNQGSSPESNVNVSFYINDVFDSSKIIPSIASGESVVTAINYTILHFGIYNFTAKVENVSGENVTANNMKSTLIPVPGSDVSAELSYPTSKLFVNISYPLRLDLENNAEHESGPMTANVFTYANYSDKFSYFDDEPVTISVSGKEFNISFEKISLSKVIAYVNCSDFNKSYLLTKNDQVLLEDNIYLNLRTISSNYCTFIVGNVRTFKIPLAELGPWGSSIAYIPWEVKTVGDYVIKLYVNVTNDISDYDNYDYLYVNVKTNNSDLRIGYLGADSNYGIAGENYSETVNLYNVGGSDAINNSLFVYDYYNFAEFDPGKHLNSVYFNGIYYNITLNNLSRTLFNVSVNYSGQNESCLLSFSQDCILENGYYITITPDSSSYEIHEILLSKNRVVHKFTFPKIKSGFSVSKDINFLFSSLGYHFLKYEVNSLNDNNENNNYGSRIIPILKNSVDLGVNVYFSHSIPLNKTFNVSIEIDNDGGIKSSNSTLKIIDLYQGTKYFSSEYISANATRTILFNGTNYTITNKVINSSYILLNISYDGNLTKHILRNNAFYPLKGNVGVFFKGYAHSLFCYFGFYNSSKINFNHKIEPYSDYTINIPWSTNQLGGHKLIVSVNATNDSTFDNNLDYTYFNVKKNAPDLNIYLNIFRPIINATSYLSYDIDNNGLKNASNINVSLFVFTNDTPYSCTMNESVTFGDINVSLYNLIEGKKVKVITLGHEYNLTLGEVVKLSNGKYLAFSSYDNVPFYKTFFNYGNATEKNFQINKTIEPGDWIDRNTTFTFNHLFSGKMFSSVFIDNDANYFDNYDSGSFSVLENKTYLSTDFYESWELLVNESHDFGVWVNNDGGLDAENITVTLYDLFNISDICRNNGEFYTTLFNGVNYTISSKTKNKINITYLGHEILSYVKEGSLIELDPGVGINVYSISDSRFCYRMGLFQKNSTKIYNLEKNNDIKMHLSITPYELGQHYFISTVNESHLSNLSSEFNFERITVYPKKPILNLYVPNQEYFAYGKNYNITFEVENRGLDNATNVSVMANWFDLFNGSDFYLNKEEDLFFLGKEYSYNATLIAYNYYNLSINFNNSLHHYLVNANAIVNLTSDISLMIYGDTYKEVIIGHSTSKMRTYNGTLGVGDFIETSISVNFSKKGRVEFISTATCPLQYGTSYSDYSLKVKDAGPDIDLYSYPSESYALNSDNGFNFYVENIGTTNATNVTFSIYVNGKIEEKENYSLILPSHSKAFYYHVNTTKLGYQRYNVIVNCSGDTDISNNVYSKTILIYKNENVTFNFKDSNGNPINRSVVSGKKDIFSLNNITGNGKVEVRSPKDDISVYYFPAPIDVNNRVILLGYFNSSINQTMNLTSDFYDKIGYKYNIIVNKPIWNFDGIGYSSYYPISLIPNYTSNYTLFSCSSWNFTSNNCNKKWKNLPTTKSAINGYVSLSSRISYSEAIGIGERDTDLDGIPDSKDNDIDGDLINNSLDNCPRIKNFNQLDTDNDSLGDVCDNDFDGDGILDSEDPVVGTIRNLKQNIILKIGNSTNVTKNFIGRKKVLFKINDKPILNFNFNFSRGKILLKNISITKQGASDHKGYAIIKGVNLTNQNETKTVYVDHLDSSITSLCIKDAEVSNISEVSEKCNGANETFIECNGKLKNGYNCTYNSTTFVVSGLKHSAVEEMKVVTDSGSPSHTHHSSGGGSAVTLEQPAKPCVSTWVCNDWSSCSSDNIKQRVCYDNCTNASKVENQTCSYDHCVNKVKDNGESDVDCGGACTPCQDGKSCVKNSDCINDCVNGICVSKERAVTTETCYDNIKNQNEEGVDCGGVCSPCNEHKFDLLLLLKIVFLVLIVLGSVLFFYFKKKSSRYSYRPRF